MKKRQSQRQLKCFGGSWGAKHGLTLPSLLGHRIINKALIDVTKLPASYTSNSPKEEHLLQVADNFSRQYSHLCPDRVPLFLHPLNECNVPVSPGRGGRGQRRAGPEQGQRGWRKAHPALPGAVLACRELEEMTPGKCGSGAQTGSGATTLSLSYIPRLLLLVLSLTM